MAQTILATFVEPMKYETTVLLVPAGLAIFSAIILAFRGSKVFGQSKIQPNIVSRHAFSMAESFQSIPLGSVIRVQH